jgi:hypothetical protein
MITVAPPTPAALDQQAAKLRAQAAKLNEEQADRIQRTIGEHGARIDSAQQAAASARATANQAVEQANLQREVAKMQVAEATGKEAEAARLAGSNDPAKRARADDLREEAQQTLAEASARSGRVQQAERLARQKLQEAEQADREVERIKGEYDDGIDAGRPLGPAANDLEAKAAQIEQASAKLRAANRDGLTRVEREHLTIEAEAHLVQADTITPDYSRVDVDTMVRAGIPVSHKPGAELMDPTTMGPATPSLPVNDTDLMRPDGTFDSSPQSGLDDTDLMRPDDLSGTTTDPYDDPLADPVAGRAGAGELPETGDFSGTPDDLGLDGSGLAGDLAPVPDTAGIEADIADIGTTGGDPYLTDPMDAPAADVADVGDTGADVAYAEPSSGEYIDDGDSYGDASDDAMSGEYA